MNIMVISDTHGETNRAIEMYDRLSASVCDIDCIVHCGDYAKDAKAIQESVGIPIISVPGNCDGCTEQHFEVLESTAGKILVTHGHMENINYSMLPLKLLAEEQGCTAVCYGHTHIPMNESVQGIRFINPGSLTNPRSGSKPSCALIIAESGRLAASIIEY